MAELPVLGNDRCENLRWKGLFVEASAGGDPGSDAILWCLKTQMCLGPDGKPVDRYECNPARPCFKAL